MNSELYLINAGATLRRIVFSIGSLERLLKLYGVSIEIHFIKFAYIVSYNLYVSKWVVV